MIKGLDVGSPQGTISLLDWRALSQQGYRFAFLRCAEGLGPVDPTFASNVAGAQTAGLHVGPYFPGHPWLDAVAQARSHFALAKGLGSRAGELGPALDLELPAPEKWAAQGLTAAAILTWALAYLAEASRLWWRPCTVYGYPYWLATLAKGADVSALAAYPLWLASYEPTPPKPPAPWANVTWWQSSGGNGAKTPAGAPMDADAFLGDEAAFAAACNPVATVPVLPVEPTLDIPTGTPDEVA